ncbi:MAG: molybdenum cofactor guanylyltransferase [Dehalococcoidia bacterium]
MEVGDAAVILAGGSSRRFGRDKSHALLDGQPMLEWVVRAVARVSDRVVIAARPGQELPPLEGIGRLEYVVDARVNAGPMAGLEAAFGLLGSGRAFVAGVDAPLLVPGLAIAVLGRLEGAHAALPVVGGRRQPLVGAYDVAVCRRAFSAALDRDERRLLTVLDELMVAELDETEVRKHDPGLRSFENLNTPEALAAVEIQMRTSGS